MALLWYILISIFVSSIHETLPFTFITVLIDTSLMLILAYTSLWISGHNERAIQTVTALAGTGGIFMLASAPFSIWLLNVPTGESSISLLFLTALMFWNVAVIGHILRHALGIPIWAGFTIAIIYTMIYYRVVGALIVTGSN